MLKLQADAYIRIGEIIHSMKSVFGSAEAMREFEPDSPYGVVEKEDIRKLKQLMKILQKICLDNGLTISETLISPRRDDLPQSSRELAILADAVKAELKARMYLHVPIEKASYYNSDSLLSEPSRLAFPGPNSELRDAANCYALEQDTASVFHSMRAAEMGLWALTDYLQIKLPHPIEMEQWLVLIDKIEAEIKTRGKKLPRGQAKDDELKFVSDAAVHLLSFKDAWRTRVAHARATFDANVSLKVLNHTCDFIEALASKLQE
ncbi:MAG TPA: hypothetical protein ENI05_00470 [Porticoccus sp.]|nr:hypothetical protein [Porticoccus sp.]